jgi:hypothetical protein
MFFYLFKLINQFPNVITTPNTNLDEHNKDHRNAYLICSLITDSHSSEKFCLAKET